MLLLTYTAWNPSAEIRTSEMPAVSGLPAAVRSMSVVALGGVSTYACDCSPLPPGRVVARLLNAATVPVAVDWPDLTSRLSRPDEMRFAGDPGNATEVR